MPQIPSALLGTPVILISGLLLFLLTVAVTLAGMQLRGYVKGQSKPSGTKHATKADDDGDDGDVTGSIIPAVLGLLALLLGFTFSLAVDRFETRRGLVLEEANAIGTAYLQTQVLPEPNRARLSALLVHYADNRLALSKEATSQERQSQLALNDSLINDIWAASLAGFDSIKQLDMSSTFASSMNAVIDLDTSRKTARMAHVPDEVFWVLVFYVLIAAALQGYVTRTRVGFYLSCMMNILVVMSLMLIIDIDRPSFGGIRESQFPMQLLHNSLHARPAPDFDKWRQVAAPQN